MNEPAGTAASHDAKELSRRAFDAQAAVYDNDMKGEHARNAPRRRACWTWDAEPARSLSS